MFQTCLLTFTIYVGSAIYTAGIPYISAEFHVSNVAATLGLTLFVAGYGLGEYIICSISSLRSNFENVARSDGLGALE